MDDTSSETASAMSDVQLIIARLEAKAKAQEAEERNNPALVRQRTAEQQQDVLRRTLGAAKGFQLPERVARWCAVSDVPERTEALQAVRAWAGDRLAWGCVLAGQGGVGKTFAAGWWAWHRLKAYVERSDSGEVWVPRGWYDAGEIARIGLFKEDRFNAVAKHPRTLVIDDLGSEYVDEKGAFVSLFFQLVNHRQANHLRTVFTTNLNRSAFRDRYGERIASRLREGGYFVEVNGPDLRSVQ